MNKSDLFDQDHIWATDPATAFAGFIQTEAFQKLSRRKRAEVVIDPETGQGVDVPSPPLRPSSLQIYKLMFGKFVRWMNRHQKTDLRQITTADLMEFLAQSEKVNNKEIKKPVSSIRLRYLQLFEKVFEHLAVKPNPAAQAILATKEQLGRDAPKVALTIEQQVAFMRALPDAEPYSGVPGSVGWQKRRDRAIQALLLGAGVTVSEVIGLYVENIEPMDISGSMSVTVSPASVGGTGRWHQTQLRMFAAGPVEEWLAERKAMKLQHKLLFPSSKKTNVRLSKVSIYRMVNETLRRAGIDSYHAGGRTLRNSYAFRELSGDAPNLELVKEFLGLHKLRSAAKYLPKK